MNDEMKQSSLCLPRTVVDEYMVNDRVGQKVAQLLAGAGYGPSRFSNYPVNMIFETIVSRPGHHLNEAMGGELHWTVTELSLTRELIRILLKQAHQWRVLMESGQMETRDASEGPSMDDITKIVRSISCRKRVELEHDVMIAYRFNSDISHAEVLYEVLTNDEMNVWMDKKSTNELVPVEERIFHGLRNSRIFIPLLSRLAINHPDNINQNFGRLLPDSPMDDLLYTFLMALELEARGFIDMIYPILIGDYDVTVGKIGHYFECGCHPTIENNVTVAAVQQKVSYYLSRYGLGDTIFDHLTVKEIVIHIIYHPGHIIIGSIVPAFLEVLRIIRKLDDMDVEDLKDFTMHTFDPSKPCKALLEDQTPQPLKWMR
jgi:hypothetical protein